MRFSTIILTSTIVLLASMGPAAGAHAAVAHNEVAETCPPTESIPPGVERISGADRFEVSARTSARSFPGGAAVVFLATGSGFADALSGSAAAGHLHGPVLLVTKDSVPASVRAEIVRLAPRDIVILGGTASISSEVERSVSGLATGSVKRISGDDRYDVSARLASQMFGTDVDTVYVASGEVFSDALSAAAAAGDAFAPVLLVQKNGVPPEIARYLAARGDVEHIIIVGGPSTVSDATALTLAANAPTQRVPGPDRYAVSAATSANQFCAERSMVFVASGEVFPDALSGSAAAIAFGSPVLLVSKNGISLQVEQELRRLDPQRIIVLGGQDTISKSLEDKLANYLRP
ncbi:cell wall-binding repeat-containing protein [Herbiconiux daphne]|uniref:Cell wall-binding repeat-containing protein n=1 Tax=Herbiconiux daphne TaxID=2970914 RepID=A0ABT2H470_9MICO|nr:cell wall-binding repeat-containing protein [Herbiconiux daphne]MCS5734729.1 cell wall-binding repeat-containing protein [Herbiconiux daphne]